MPNNTHLGQPASQLVVLEEVIVATTGDSRKDLDFFRILPDCTLAGSGPGGSAGFRVPPGETLIVTDVDWEYDFGPPGGRQTLRIWLESLTDPLLSRIVFTSTATMNANGQGGARVAMTAGFVVSPGVRLAVGTNPNGVGLPGVGLMGYLVPTLRTLS